MCNRKNVFRTEHSRLYKYLLNSGWTARYWILYYKLHFYEPFCTNVYYLVVKGTFMLVRVSMNGAEQSSASAGEPGQSNLLLANKTPILLFLAVPVTRVTVLAIRNFSGGVVQNRDCRNCWLSCF